MRPLFVVIVAPTVQLFLCVLGCPEQIHVQAFVPQLAVKALDVAVLHRFAWPDILDLDLVLMRPLIEGPATELWAIIAADRFRITLLPGYSIQLLSDSVSGKVQRRYHTPALAVPLIDLRQYPNVAAVFQPICHKVNRPRLIGSLWGFSNRLPLLTG